jgi:hypothetical protein
VDDGVGAAERFRQPIDIGEVLLDQLRAELDEMLSPPRVAYEREDSVAAVAERANHRTTDKTGPTCDGDPPRILRRWERRAFQRVA